MPASAPTITTICSNRRVTYELPLERPQKLPPRTGPALLVLGYLCAVLAFGMLFSLYKFLRRIEAGQIFVSANVTALRRISWCCVGAAVLCLPAGVGIYLPFAFLGVAAAFMALIVRVLKNAFEQAVRMKDELDLTI